MNSVYQTLSARTLLCLLLALIPLSARTVHGVVTDGQGRPVSGAPVRLKNDVTLRIRSARSGRDGSYRFTGLDARVDYQLRATFKGHSSGWVYFSRFDEGEERVLDLKVK